MTEGFYKQNPHCTLCRSFSRLFTYFTYLTFVCFPPPSLEDLLRGHEYAAASWAEDTSPRMLHRHWRQLQLQSTPGLMNRTFFFVCFDPFFFCFSLIADSYLFPRFIFLFDRLMVWPKYSNKRFSPDGANYFLSYKICLMPVSRRKIAF